METLDDQGSPLIAANVTESCTHPRPGNAGPAAQQVVTLNIPDAVRALMDARIAYSNRVPQNLDDATALRDVAQVDAEHPRQTLRTARSLRTSTRAPCCGTATSKRP